MRTTWPLSPSETIEIEALAALVSATLDHGGPLARRRCRALIERLVAAGMARLDDDRLDGRPAARLVLRGVAASSAGDETALLRAWRAEALARLALEARP